MNMNIVIATKPLQDGTKGFWFNFLGKQGIVRKRKYKSISMRRVTLDTATAYHIGKFSLYTWHKDTPTNKIFSIKS